MDDEDKLLRDTNRAARAEGLLSNSLLVEAFKGLEDAYTLAWRSTTIEDVSAREKLFLAINIVGKVRDNLTSIVTDGKLAQAQIKILAETAERKKRFGVI